MLELSQARLHLQKGVQENFWPGFTLAVFSHGKFAAYTGGNVPTPATSVPWYSAGKPVTALGVLHLAEQKPNLWPLPMEKTFPELLGTYLGNLTLLDILTHRTGLRLSTLPDLLSLPHLHTLNLGHSLVAHAIHVGLEQSVRDFLQAITKK